MLPTLALYLGAFVAVLGVVVAVHEWGHYAAGRLLGLRVQAFSIGMGPEIWSRRDSRGCTWRLAALPVGGYVRFLGDADGGGGAPSADLASLPADPREIYQLRSPAARAFVLVAGPAVNVALGIAILAALYLANGRPYTAPEVGEVVVGSPAERAGIRIGDRIVSVDGSPVAAFEDVYEKVSLRPDTSLRIGVSRDGRDLALDVRTERVVTQVMGSTQTVGRIGIAPSGDRAFLGVSPVEAVGYAAKDVYKLTTSMFVAIGQIASGTRPLDDLGGPVKVAEMSGRAAEVGPTALVFFLAVISANIGVVNLLPLGVLDGGQLVMCAVEAIRRRPFSRATLTRYNAVSIAALVALMVVLTANDIGGLVGRLAG